MAKRELLLGDEALALGALHAGLSGVYAYPGTPTPSNTSKVLRSVEQKGLVTRELCNEDRRQMYYSLTQQGRELLASVSCREVETPEILRDWLCG